jgi:hypothetical protein
MSKKIIVLLHISYIYIIYTILLTFFIGQPLGIYWLAPPWARFIVFSIYQVRPCYEPSCYKVLIPFYILLLLTGVIDFTCAYYISKGKKSYRITSYRIASYRSLITCLLGFLLFILGRFVFIPRFFTPWPLMIEGFVYFLFYGILFYLLMINKTKKKKKKKKKRNEDNRVGP